jgi:hypothetical protein
MQRLKIAKTDSLKVLLIEVAANAMHYNPMLAMQHLESNGYLAPLMDLWLKLAKKKKTPFTRLHDKRVSILGLSSVYLVSFDPLPNHLKSKFVPILLAILKQQQEAEEQRIEEENEEDEEDDDVNALADGDVDGDDEDISSMRKAWGKGQESSEDEDGFDEDEDDNDDADIDEALNAALAAQDAPIDEGNVAGDNEDIDEYDGGLSEDQIAILERLAENEVREFDLDDDYEFESALDEIEPSLYFMEAFHGWGSREGQHGQALLSSLSAKQHKQLNAVSEIAMERKRVREQNQNQTQ